MSREFDPKRFNKLLELLQYEVNLLKNENKALKTSLEHYEGQESIKKVSQEARIIGDHDDGVWDIDCSKNGEFLVSSSADGTVHVHYQGGTDEEFKQYLTYNGHNGSVNSCRFHPTESLILTASGDRTVHIIPIPLENINPITLNPQISLDVSNSPVIAAHWLDSHYIATGSWDHLIRVYNILDDDETTPTIYKGHTDRITNITCMNKRSVPLILSSSLDGTVRVWDTRKPPQKNCICIAAHVSLMGQANVNTALFNPNGEVIATAGDDKQVNIFDTRSYKSPLIEINLSSNCNRLSFSNNGAYLAAPLDNGLTSIHDKSGTTIEELNNNNNPYQKRRRRREMSTSSCWRNNNHNHSLFVSSFDTNIYQYVL